MDSDVGVLFEKARDGDPAAWDALVDQFINLVWSVVRSFGLEQRDAEDVVQMTWLRLVENFESVKEPDRIGLWLSTTARREALRCINKKKRAVLVDPGASFGHIGDDAPEVGADVANRQLAESVLVALQQLEPGCQALLRLVLCDPPLSYEQISVALDVPIGTIGPRRQRCLKKLRAALPTLFET